MFDEVVLETDSNRVGGLVSSSGARLEVVFGKGEPSVFVNRGKSYQTIKLPSLTLLQRAAPEHLKRLWEEEPHYILQLALDQLPEEKRSSREAGKILRQGTLAMDADAKKLAPLFKELEKRELISLVGGKPDKLYRLLAKPESLLPEALQWLTRIESSPATAPAPSEEPGREGQEGSKFRGLEVEEAEVQPVTNPPAEAKPGLFDYLLAASDEAAAAPIDFETWISSPFERAMEISKMTIESGSVSLRKPSVFAYSLVSLLPDRIWKAAKSNDSTLTKIRNSSLLTTIAQNWKKDWHELPNFKELIGSEFDIGKQIRPVTAMQVLAALGKADIQDSEIAIKLFEKVLNKAPLTAIEIRELINEDKDSGFHLCSAAISSFSASEFRTRFLVWGFRQGVLAPSEQALEGFSFTGLSRLVEEINGSIVGKTRGWISQRYDEVMRVISAFSGPLMDRVGDEESLLSALRLQAMSQVELDPDRLAKFVLATCNRHERLQQLGRSLAGSSLAKELQSERDNLEVRLKEVQAKLEHLQEDAEAMRSELVESRKRSLSERQSGQSSIRAEQKALEIPALKILARSLSAAQEFLEGNQGALGRFEIFADQAGLEKIGEPGQEVTFDPKEHSDPEEEAQVGQAVKVQSVGYRLENEGEYVVLLKAAVVIG